MPAYYHAPSFFLALIDRVQDRFLDELGMSPSTALWQFSLAPLTTRRDIAMLGLLQRISLGLAPEPLAALFPCMAVPRFPRDMRGRLARHSRQFRDRCDGSQPPSFERSIFGLVYTYNLLPQSVVNVTDVPEFQRALQQAACRACNTGMPSWPLLFRHGVRRLAVAQFQELFALRPGD